MAVRAASSREAACGPMTHFRTLMLSHPGGIEQNAGALAAQSVAGSKPSAATLFTKTR